MNKIFISFCMLFFCIFYISFIAPSAQARDKFLEIQEHTTPAGLTLWLVEDPSIPVVAIEFAFENAGAKHDGAEKQGLARLVSNTMDEGAGDKEAGSENSDDYAGDAFQETLRAQSISLSFASGRDTYGGSLKTRTSTLNLAADMLRVALNYPHFEQDDIQRMKDANIARIRASLSDPEWIAARLVNDVAFADHPYAFNSGGSVTTLQNLTQNDLKEFVRRRLARDVLKIAITGDITANAAKELVDKTFGTLPEKQTLKDAVNDLEIQNSGKLYLYELDIPQSIIRALQPAISRSHPDYYAYQVMNQILGAGGFGSRLTEEIREKRGLTYGIYTSLSQMEHVSLLTLGVQTANKNTGEVLKLSTLEMEKMANAPVSAEELNNAISYINGSLPLTLSSTSNIARLLLGMQLDDLPIHYLDARAAKFEAVSAAEVQQAAAKYLAPQSLTTVIVGKPEGINLKDVTKLSELPNVE